MVIEYINIKESEQINYSNLSEDGSIHNISNMTVIKCSHVKKKQTAKQLEWK